MNDAFFLIVEGVVLFIFLSLPVDFVFQLLKFPYPFPATDNLLMDLTTALDQIGKI